MGTAIGSDAGQVSAREAQHRYDIAYAQCMASNGNQIGSQAVDTAPRYHRRRHVIVVPAEQSPVYYYTPTPAPVYQPPPPPVSSSAPVYPPPGTLLQHKGAIMLRHHRFIQQFRLMGLLQCLRQALIIHRQTHHQAEWPFDKLMPYQPSFYPTRSYPKLVRHCHK